jgi:outer membrane receptor protein involved in Fe transport
MNNPERFETSTESLEVPSVLKQEWSGSTLKFSVQLEGNSKSLQANTYINYGNNIKFPSVLQQLSTPSVTERFASASRSNLEPEKNSNFEIGIELLRDLGLSPSVTGWSLSCNYFKSTYENKFRMYRIFNSPVLFFDNVPAASISGFDLKSRLFFLKNTCKFEAGVSTYNISDKSAFPFKFDTKFISNLYIDSYGYAFQLHWFREGSQVGLYRYADGRFRELLLPGYSNIDLHFGKTVEIGSLRIFGNLSARNIINNSTIVSGLPLRDRRFYLTLGVEY